MPSSLTIEALASDSDPAFEDFYRIYSESISSREQKPRAQISRMLGRADYRVLLLKRRGQTVGFSILFLPQKQDFVLLEYMAVDSRYRSTGLGGELFRLSVAAAPRTPSVLLEVDSVPDQAADNSQEKRRVEFYRRMGCLRIDELSYILPLPGTGPPPKMDLMIYPAPGVQTIPKFLLERWLKEIYTGVYNCDPDDPRVSQMLRGVGDPAFLD